MKKIMKKIAAVILSVCMLITVLGTLPFTAAADDDYLKLTGGIRLTNHGQAATINGSASGSYTLTLPGGFVHTDIYFTDMTAPIDYKYCYIDVITMNCLATQQLVFQSWGGMPFGDKNYFPGVGCTRLNDTPFDRITPDSNGLNIRFYTYNAGSLVLSIYFTNDPDFVAPESEPTEPTEPTEPVDPPETDTLLLTGKTTYTGSDLVTPTKTEGRYRIVNTGAEKATTITFTDFSSVSGYDYCFIDYYKVGAGQFNWHGVQITGVSSDWTALWGYGAGCYKVDVPGGKLPAQINNLRFYLYAYDDCDVYFSIYLTNDPNFKPESKKITGTGQVIVFETPSNMTTVSKGGVYRVDSFDTGEEFGYFYFNDHASRINYKYCFMDIIDAYDDGATVLLSLEGVCNQYELDVKTGLIRLNSAELSAFTPANVAGLRFTFHKTGDLAGITFSLYFTDNPDFELPVTEVIKDSGPHYKLTGSITGSDAGTASLISGTEGIYRMTMSNANYRFSFEDSRYDAANYKHCVIDLRSANDGKLPTGAVIYDKGGTGGTARKIASSDSLTAGLNYITEMTAVTDFSKAVGTLEFEFTNTETGSDIAVISIYLAATEKFEPDEYRFVGKPDNISGATTFSQDSLGVYSVTTTSGGSITFSIKNRTRFASRYLYIDFGPMSNNNRMPSGVSLADGAFDLLSTAYSINSTAGPNLYRINGFAFTEVSENLRITLNFSNRTGDTIRFSIYASNSESFKPTKRITGAAQVTSGSNIATVDYIKDAYELVKTGEGVGTVDVKIPDFKFTSAKYCYFDLRVTSRVGGTATTRPAYVAIMDGSTVVATYTMPALTGGAAYTALNTSNLPDITDLGFRIALTGSTVLTDEESMVFNIYLSDALTVGAASRDSTLPNYTTAQQKVTKFTNRSKAEGFNAPNYVSTDGSISFQGRSGNIYTTYDATSMTVLGTLRNHKYLCFQIADTSQSNVGSLPNSVTVAAVDEFGNIGGSLVKGNANGIVWTRDANSGNLNVMVPLDITKDLSLLTLIFNTTGMMGNAKINYVYFTNNPDFNFASYPYTDIGIIDFEETMREGEQIIGWTVTRTGIAGYNRIDDNRGLEITAPSQTNNSQFWIQGSNMNLRNYNYVYVAVDSPDKSRDIMDYIWRVTVSNGTTNNPATGSSWVYLKDQGATHTPTGPGLIRINVSSLTLTATEARIFIDSYVSVGKMRILGAWMSNNPSFMVDIPDTDPYQVMVNANLKQTGSVTVQQDDFGAMTFNGTGSCSFSPSDFGNINVTKKTYMYVVVEEGAGNIGSIVLKDKTGNIAFSPTGNIFSGSSLGGNGLGGGSLNAGIYQNGINCFDVSAMDAAIKSGLSTVTVNITGGKAVVSLIMFSAEHPDAFEPQFLLNSGGRVTDVQLLDYEAEINATVDTSVADKITISGREYVDVYFSVYPEPGTTMEAMYVYVNNITSDFKISVLSYVDENDKSFDTNYRLLDCKKIERNDMENRWIRLDLSQYDVGQYPMLKFSFAGDGSAGIDSVTFNKTVKFTSLMPYTVLRDMSETGKDFGPLADNKTEEIFDETFFATGTLKDAAGNALNNVTMILNQGKEETKTDEKGNFVLDALCIGEHKIVIKNDKGEVIYIFNFTVTANEKEADGVSTFMYNKLRGFSFVVK